MDLRSKFLFDKYDFKNAKVKTRFVDDSCNFFDEWQADRLEYNITSDKFSWSPDDPCLDSEITLSDPDAKDFYQKNLRDKYIDCSKLETVNSQMKITDGHLRFNNVVHGNSVVFYEITFE